MVNYQNGKIYKLKCHTTNQIYIGSTTERLLCQRLRYHVKDYNRYKLNEPKLETSGLEDPKNIFRFIT